MKTVVNIVYQVSLNDVVHLREKAKKQSRESCLSWLEQRKASLAVLMLARWKVMLGGRSVLICSD